MRSDSIWLGDIQYKKYQPCQCEICHLFRPAHLCIHHQNIGIVCDQCQATTPIQSDKGVIHEVASLQI